MSKLRHAALLVLTVIPGVYMLYFMFGMSGAAFDSIVRIHVAIMILTVILAVIYIRDVFRNEAVPHEKKAVWAVVLLLGGFVGQLIYFWYYLRDSQNT